MTSIGKKYVMKKNYSPPFNTGKKSSVLVDRGFLIDIVFERDNINNVLRMM